MIGTHYDKDGIKENVFKRTLSTVPSVNAECYLISGQKLKDFMQAITSVSSDEEAVSLDIGKYSIDEEAMAFLNGNKFFQRHAVIVGSTGSGKSWSVARILEQVAQLKSANAILFDIHGEYTPLNYVDRLHGIKGQNYQLFVNIIPEIRQAESMRDNSIMMERVSQLIGTCNDALQRHVGNLDRELNEERKGIFNPFICFREGIRFIIGLPALILYWME